jgi:hypothetical protein
MKAATELSGAESGNVGQQYFDFAQAGKYLGKSAEAIRGYVNRGMLLASKRGGKLRFIKRAELDRFASGADL